MPIPNREIDEIREMVEENNRILRNLQAKARFATIFATIKWIIIIGIALGIYSFIQPFISQITETYSSIKDSAATIQEIKNDISTGTDFNRFTDFFKRGEE